MRADADLESVASVLCILAKVLLILDTVVADSVREEDEVCSEWKGPSASDCYLLVRSAFNEGLGW